MIRKPYVISPSNALYWILEIRRRNRGYRFKPKMPIRDLFIRIDSKRILRNKHTVGTE